MENFRRVLVAIVASLLIAACGLLRRSPDPNAPCPVPPTIAIARWAPTVDSGAIDGTVLHVDSLRDTALKPLDGSYISVNGPVERSTYGDSAGHFRLTNLPAGQYLIRVRRIGYPTRTDSLRVGPGGVTGVIRLRSDVVLFPTCCHSPICL